MQGQPSEAVRGRRAAAARNPETVSCREGARGTSQASRARQSAAGPSRAGGAAGRPRGRAQKARARRPLTSRKRSCLSGLALPAETVRAWRHLLALLAAYEVPGKAQKALLSNLLLDPQEELSQPASGGGGQGGCCTGLLPQPKGPAPAGSDGSQTRDAESQRAGWGLHALRAPLCVGATVPCLPVTTTAAPARPFRVRTLESPGQHDGAQAWGSLSGYCSGILRATLLGQASLTDFPF